MDDSAKEPEEVGAAEESGPVQDSGRAGRAVIEGAGSVVSATMRGVRSLGRGVRSVAERGWGVLTTGRARRAEARVEAAREAARLRALQLGGSAPLEQPDLAEESASEPQEEPREAPEEEPEAELEEAPEEEPEAELEEAPEEEPEAELEEAPEEEPEAELEEAPEEEPEADLEEAPEKEPTPSVTRGDRARVLVGGVMGTLQTGAKRTGKALARTGRAMGPAVAATGRAASTSGRTIRAGLIRVGKAVGPASAAIGLGIVAAGRVLGRGFGRVGRSLGSMGAVAFPAIGRVFRRMGGALRRRLHRLRQAWEAGPERPRLWVSIGAVSVMIIGYLLAQASVASRVAPDTTVLGLDVGGASIEEARGLVEEQLLAASSSAISISAHGRVVVMDPEELGLGIDVEATLASLAGFSWSPSALWRHAAGAGPIEPVVTVDEDLFDHAVEEVAAVLRQEAKDAEVSLGPTGASVQAGQDGVDVAAEDVARTLLEAWPSNSPIAVPMKITPATRDTGEAQRFARAVNDIVLGSPVTLSSPNGSVTITPEDVIASGVIVPDGSGFGLEMDEEVLATLILDRVPEIENSAIDARFAFDSKHQLFVKPGTPARTLDMDTLSDTVALTVMSASRAGEIPLVESPPSVTTEDLENSDFQELVSTYYTEFTPREPSREHNIANAASKIVGVVVEPGEEFSITDAIGPISRANGYVSAGVIVGGVHTNGMGGGLCQIATTSYVAAYLAGFDIVERRGHTEWFSRYPAGRDAAITTGVDMRFKNDTPYAMMFNAYVENAGLRVDIWSTPYYTVEASSSAKYNITGGGYRTETETPCYPSSPKYGFTITDTRKVFLEGELVKTENRVTTYRAVSGRKCA